MNKVNFVAQVAEKSGLDRRQAEAAVEAFMDVVVDALKEGDKVQLIGFGTFEVKQRAERQGRNPATGEAITIPASNVPSFKPGKMLKDSL